MAKKKQIRNVLCFLVMIVILMSVMPVSVFAVNDSDNATGVSNPLIELENAFTKKSPSSGDCAPVPDADLPEIYLNDTPECVLSSDSGNDTNIIILTDVSDGTRETVSALGCDVYVKIDDPCCVGYCVYVDGVYQFTEGQDGTPDGYCAFYVSAGTHTTKITKNGRSASKTNYFQCGTTYRWISMPHCWCEDGDDDDCKYPPTVTFDKTKYYEGDTVHATVSTSQSSVNYKIKDCGGTIRKSGTTSNGKKISYTIPTGASKCCYWQICFYWNEGGPIVAAGAGGEVTALSYDCTKCYKFYVCPVQTCEVYVKIDDPYCVGYKVYVDGVYQFTEGEGETPDGYCAFHVKEGTHTLKITKNGRSASKTINFECNIVYRWVSMPDNWCNPCVDPPTATFDKQKYNEGDTMHATVSTSLGSVNYKIKDCGGNIRKSGDISNGGMISYTIPTGASECCNWQICFYWGENSPPIVAAGAGGAVTAQSYECIECYTFEVCPINCPSEVKFEGTAKTDELSGLVCYKTYYCDVIVDQILYDPDNTLTVGNTYTVGYGDTTKHIKSGDKIIINGTYYHSCGPLNQMGHICGDVWKDLPDLIVDDITWPSRTVCLSDQISITVTVKNIGDDTADQSVVKYYEGNNYVDFDNVPSLSPGATSTQTFTWTASSCGDVPVKAVADANNEVRECDENNNEKAKTVRVDGPDLIIQDVTVPTEKICLDQPVTITVMVKNQGGCTADASVVKYYVDNKYSDSDNIPSLSPGASSTQTFTWIASTCGDVSVKAVADANNEVRECDESNNEKAKTVRVDGSDLVIQDIIVPTEKICLDQPVTITVTVKNQGGCTADASVVKYYVNNQYIDSDSIPSLSPGASSTQTFTWIASSCGDVPVKAIADANNDVKECDENNNENQKSIEVDGPDLIIQDVTVPSGKICLNNSINIEVTTENIGKCPAKNEFIMTLYVDNKEKGTATIDYLEAGKTIKSTFVWTPDTCGNLTIKAVADANNTVHECDETNNEKRKSIEVNGPDLIIQNITLPSGNIWLGNTVNIEVTTKNIGKCPAEGPFTVTLYLDSQERSVTVNNLEAGDTNISSFEWTPDTCGIFNIKAVADTGDNVDECDEDNNESTETVEVVQEIEIYDLSPADNVIISSNDVVFSWKTSVESNAELYIKSEDEGEFTKITGESGLSHVVNITLDRNKNYTWYAKSCGYDKCVESQVRSFYIDNGIVFLQNEYVFNIERDYNQQVKISVKNSDNEPHDLLLSASNPYEDIFLGFVGEGSMDRIITLYPDEVKDIAFVIHTQDAMLENYAISINLTNIGAENITDCAVVHLNVRWPNINFGVEEMSADPLTLLKTVRVINNGDKLTDLSITVDEGLKNKIIMQPSLSHYTLERGVDIKVSPSWSEGVGVIQGNLIIEAAGETKELFLDFSCPEGKEIHEVTLEHPLLYYDLKGMWCINCGHVEDTFELPAGVTEENVIFALIGLHLNAGSSQTTSYDVNIGINDHTVGTLSNVIPKGYYEFDIDSSYLNYATTETATNKYTLDTNMNPGYLTSLSNVRVVICLDELKLYICAENEAEAYNIAWGLPHIEEQSEDILVEIISPEEGSELEPGETLIKAIVTGDNDGKQLCRVRATFSNSDDEIVLLDDGLHDDGGAGDAIYANTWNAEVGDYEITVTARNCKAEGKDIVNVGVDEPPILPVPYYDQGGTKWCAMNSISMILRYNNVDWEPWEIAAEYGKARDEGLSSLDIAGVQGVGGIDDKIKSKFGLDAETRRFYGTDSTEEIDQYIKDKVDDGHPVYMGFTREKHAIIAVGYNEKHIFLHDPSGAITHKIFGEPSDRLIAVPILWADFNQKLIDGRSWAKFVTTLAITTPIDKPKTQGSVYMLDYDEGSYDGGIYFQNRNDYDDKGALRFDGTYPDGYRIVKVGDPSIERTPTQDDSMSLSFTVANPTSTQRDYAVKSSFINRDTGITIDELSSVWDLSIPPHSIGYKGSSYSNQLSHIDTGDYTLVIELFDDTDTTLDSLQFDYKIDSNVPNLIVAGGLPYYDEPLQVFFKDSEVHVTVQNPDEYTYIVEYWNDSNINLIIDDREWKKENRFNDRTTSESKFDLPLQELAIGLYRVKIDGTNYVSNNFYVIFNATNCGLSENQIENYWLSENTKWWDICVRFKISHITTTSHKNNELLLTMASISGYEYNNRPFTENIAIENFAWYINSIIEYKGKTTPPGDIKEHIEDIKSGRKKLDGDCDVYAAFLVALARSSGIPARFIAGVGDPGWVFFGWRHAWTEVYYNGNWRVWDITRKQEPFDSYESYMSELRHEAEPLNSLYNVFDERDVDRCPDYGPCDKTLNRITGVIRCPANLHAYDSQGRHVGMNAQGDIDLEIPDAYYTGPDSEPESIIILNQTEDITFKIGALDVGEFNFTLIQSTETKTTTLTYSNVSIIQTTEATVDVSEANPNYLMEIDYDGDGTTDYTIEPDSVETPGQNSYSIQLHSGWNLISLPIMPNDSAVLDVMSSVDGNWNSVWSYEGGNWKRYDLTGPDFLNDLTTIETGKGYWINMKSADTLYVSGSEPTIKSIPLSSSWNLVGYNYLSSMSTADAMSSVVGNWNSVWSYENGNWKRYDLTGPDFLNDLTTMEPGKGYWIDMKLSDTWSLGA